MIPFPLERITEQTLEELRANPVREKNTIDYKSATYGNNRQQHIEFLADVSSFANTNGGDLVIGVQELDGMPTAIPGIAIRVDEETQRLQ